MAIEDRRARERSARRDLIVSTARALAEAEGWEAVTTRRLSTEIEYSQPVLYKHFHGMEQIAEAVALDGFVELARALRAARAEADSPADVVTRTVRAYLDFAHANPAVYDAMFTRVTTLRFADDETPPALRAAFSELHQSVALVADGQDVDTLTEVLWATVHGLVTLGRSGRLRAGHEADRLRLLVEQLTDGVGDATSGATSVVPRRPVVPVSVDGDGN